MSAASTWRSRVRRCCLGCGRAPGQPTATSRTVGGVETDPLPDKAADRCSRSSHSPSGRRRRRIRGCIDALPIECGAGLFYPALRSRARCPPLRVGVFGPTRPLRRDILHPQRRRLGALRSGRNDLIHWILEAEESQSAVSLYRERPHKKDEVKRMTDAEIRQMAKEMGDAAEEITSLAERAGEAILQPLRDIRDLLARLEHSAAPATLGRPRSDGPLSRQPAPSQD